MIKKIELLIEKKEDLVFLMQGLNTIRMHNVHETHQMLDILSQTTGKPKESFDSIIERASINDRLMSLVVQLDKYLEA